MSELKRQEVSESGRFQREYEGLLGNHSSPVNTAYYTSETRNNYL